MHAVDSRLVAASTIGLWLRRLNFTKFDVGLAEDHEEVAGAGLLEELGTHPEVGVHAGTDDRQASEGGGLLPHHRVEREAADDEQIGDFDGFLGGVTYELRADRAELRPDRDRGCPGVPVL